MAGDVYVVYVNYPRDILPKSSSLFFIIIHPYEQADSIKLTMTSHQCMTASSGHSAVGSGRHRNIYLSRMILRSFGL